MALTTQFVIVFVTFMIVSGLLFTSLHRTLARETAAREVGNNVLEECLHILGRSGLAGVADSIENSSDPGSSNAGEHPAETYLLGTGESNDAAQIGFRGMFRSARSHYTPSNVLFVSYNTRH
jgi:hypothetical protein